MLTAMSHREDLLAGAVRCLREKGYARTTARDIVAASGTNLASIGYHYGSTKALLNAAVLRAMDEFGTEIAQAMQGAANPSAIERFERFWTQVLDSFQASTGVWRASFDAFTVAQRNDQVRAAIADGMEDARMLWARVLYGEDASPQAARAIGSVYQALLSGILAQWLIDPERVPSAAELAMALQAIGGRMAAENAQVPADNAKV
jgi:AcrR family transcriptional regulator